MRLMQRTAPCLYKVLNKDSDSATEQSVMQKSINVPLNRPLSKDRISQRVSQVESSNEFKSEVLKKEKSMTPVRQSIQKSQRPISQLQYQRPSSVNLTAKPRRAIFLAPESEKPKLLPTKWVFQNKEYPQPMFSAYTTQQIQLAQDSDELYKSYIRTVNKLNQIKVRLCASSFRISEGEKKKFVQ